MCPYVVGAILCPIVGLYWSRASAQPGASYMFTVHI